MDEIPEDGVVDLTIHQLDEQLSAKPPVLVPHGRRLVERGHRRSGPLDGRRQQDFVDELPLHLDQTRSDLREAAGNSENALRRDSDLYRPGD